ncbi:protein of unknown function [Salinimicrobium catena]|uniref:DUF4382 domain-containing protein n=1 Tax=Salinimicrobium catena TaxID=390640 RepID=A0A1H5J101_9FLAO|nr:DUF4382 domain-containing protein [Salinimicrobium catena]SDK82942.1 protein of unknown function [Salinimicrobium catena]SEE46195.1 protein of unknown function [Salinimicrobium catena]
MKKYNLFLMLFVFAATLISCSDDEDDSMNTEGTAQVAVKLTDAPGDYEEVWVEVEDVMVKMEAETTAETGTESDGETGDEEGWVSLGIAETKEINLLELTGGVTEFLAEAEIPAGYLQEIRLVLGDNNTIVVDGNELVLDTPSAQQSGLKLKVGQELQADTYYTFILDFDVDQSVVSQGNGGYSLKPVIRLSLDETSGSIAGIVTGSTEPVLVEAQSSAGTVSAYTNAEGVFQLHGLEPGTYVLTATPEEGLGLEAAVVNNIEVEQGVVTELEEPIILEGSTETETGTGTEG